MPDENKEWMRAEQDRRRSSVAQPHRNRKKYRRADAKRDVRAQAERRDDE